MSEISDSPTETADALGRELKQLGLSENADDWTDRYLLCEHLVDPPTARARQRFEAIARFSRDMIAHRWVKTRQARERAKPKRIYYLSLEFLIGRALNNNIMNMSADPLVAPAVEREGWDLAGILEQEPDAGLGNGGLGRLAACFIDSLATLQYSAMGYGLRYEYGIFRQSIHDGYQAESPDNWLRRPDPREIARSRRCRFLQQYFMVSCTLQDILARFHKDDGQSWSDLPNHVVIQLNDTHPALAVAELMRFAGRLPRRRLLITVDPAHRSNHGSGEPETAGTGVADRLREPWAHHLR